VTVYYTNATAETNVVLTVSKAAASFTLTLNSSANPAVTTTSALTLTAYNADATANTSLNGTYACTVGGALASPSGTAATVPSSLTFNNGVANFNVQLYKAVAQSLSISVLGVSTTPVSITPVTTATQPILSTVTATTGSAITITAPGTGFTSWLAPTGTTSFTSGPTMTTSTGSATSINVPTTAGSYKLYTVDQYGNPSTASTATLVAN